MMNFNNINKITFTKRDFDDKLYLKIAQQIQLLVESGNIVTIYDADQGKGTVVLEYVSANALDGQPYPYYLYPDEAAFVSAYHDQRTLAIKKEEVKQLESQLQQKEDELNEAIPNKKYDA